MIRPDLSLPIPENIGAAHFIGIGGSGMSGLARMFLARGIRVSGSDRADSDALRQLALLGARVHVGHDAANLGDADTVIHTGAIWPENPEYVLDKERGMPVIHRSQALHWLIGGRRLVSVAGAHGKTTSTGILSFGATARCLARFCASSRWPPAVLRFAPRRPCISG